MKKIGIDLDDILLDFNGAFIEYHNSKYGTTLKKENTTTFFLEEILDIPREEAMLRLRDFYLSSHHEEAAPIDGAVEALVDLARTNKLLIISASPEEIRIRIESWLKKHFINTFESIHFTRKMSTDTHSLKKSEVCQSLGIDVFVDDALHNAENIAECGIPVLLLDRPWNQGEVPKLVTRVYSWSEIVKKLA